MMDRKFMEFRACQKPRSKIFLPPAPSSPIRPRRVSRIRLSGCSKQLRAALLAARRPSDTLFVFTGKGYVAVDLVHHRESSTHSLARLIADFVQALPVHLFGRPARLVRTDARPELQICPLFVRKPGI